jgi:uncharacterized protein
MTVTPWTFLVLGISAFVAGAMNSIAGGGTLLTFPALLLTGIHPVMANATSTVALVPGSMAGAWGYRRELETTRRWLALLIPPCIIGGAVGTLLVTELDQKYFSFLIPWLILTATLLFLCQPLLTRITGIGKKHSEPAGPTLAAIVSFQFVVAVYGGYFGAGIGILMLSSLPFLGLSDIHRMNAVKTILAACINVVSVAVFAAKGQIVWSLGPVMAIAAIAGGYVGARLARRLKPIYVRRVVIAIGLVLSTYFFYRGA